MHSFLLYIGFFIQYLYKFLSQYIQRRLQSSAAFSCPGRGLLLYAQDDCSDSIHVARAAWQFNRLWGEESTERPNNIGWMAVLPTLYCSQSNASSGGLGAGAGAVQSHRSRWGLMAGDPCGSRSFIVFVQTIWWSLWNAGNWLSNG